MGNCAALLKILRAILGSTAKPVYGRDARTIKGFIIYLPYERYREAQAVIENALQEQREA